MLDRPAAVAEAPTRPDPVAAVAVILFAMSTVGLALGGILAIYDWRTPAAVKPLFYAVLGTFFAAVVVLVVGATIRWARSGLR